MCGRNKTVGKEARERGQDKRDLEEVKASFNLWMNGVYTVTSKPLFVNVPVEEGGGGRERVTCVAE